MYYCMGGFEKINLDSRPSADSDQVRRGQVQSMARKRKKKFMLSKRTIGIIVAVVVVLGIAVGIPAYKTYKAGIKTYRQAKVFYSAVKQQNIAVASDELATTKQDLLSTQKDFHYLIPFKFVPIVGWYYNDVDHMLNAGSDGLDTAGIVIDSLKPYADVLGLKGGGSFTSGSAEDRIQTAVMTMGKVTPRIDDISTSLNKVKSEIDQVNSNHYPAFLFGKKLHDQLTEVKSLSDEGVTFVSQARPLIKVLPTLLGENEAQKYLVIFQNDKELRPTGGFITAYTIFDLDKGNITVDKSDDIYTLDDSIPNKPAAPAPILAYLPKVYSWNLRDSNLSPDFLQSMKTFRSMYAKAGGYVPVDGIIAIDTHVLVSTIKILDDEVTADGITFTTKTDAHCDCPQVIYQLENNISRPVDYIRTDRKGLLGDLLYAIMQKALTSSPKVYWGPLFQSMLVQTQQKHVLFDLYNDNAEQGIEAMNGAGQILPFDGDYLNINDTNFAGAKTNLFLQEAVTNQYDVKSDGTVTKTVTINYKDPYPPSDCNLASGGLCLNATLRNWLRIYVPKGSKLISSSGSQVKIKTYDDLGKTVFDGFLTVRPEGASTFTISYELPFKVSSAKLPAMIQKQPGTNDNQYTIIVNGRQVDSFPLLTDKSLELEVH